ncbi:pre-mRNA-processing ATP-dependent RNA helicase PRP5 [Verticillium alfalfae VaMs.102]|uniref:RNA helicase n=1 Tax=Verticillium alfalfae (strain VaMs.102 / ATCC MYA-4576 / FGSC 10136) TaxID=526221 RepID=C9SID2_VERA1|nr:pre-mRNA-processing ATP-dependent RNA helicase PRP5 [Verticillium alfalfae VaMs.102]EEY18705.1 pre-mRNA-processing ATP-dependent RNA helicase PRP5 [Verticillium alfalfae VaMs.102]
MARTRDSRSPSPAGSHHSSRRRKEDDRRESHRRDDGRDYRRRDRTRSPADVRTHRGRRDEDFSDRTHEQRRYRDRDSDRRPRDDRDAYRRRDRSVDRDDGRRRQRRSRERYPDRERERDRSADRRRYRDGDRDRDRDRDYRPRRDDSRDRNRRASGGKPPAEMDQKSVASPTVASPAVALPSAASPRSQTMSGPASPAPYAGKFDPKAIAKKSAASSHKHGTANGVLGAFDAQVSKTAAPVKQDSKAFALPANRGNISTFGFSKSSNEKPQAKRKLVLDEEDDTKRKLTKLPALPLEADDTPYADQDEGDDGDSDGDIFAENEEEAAAAARAAHERREREMKVDTDEAPETNGTTEEKADGDEMEVDGAGTEPSAPVVEEVQPEPVREEPQEVMKVDEEEEDDDADPLDAFMADLQETGSRPAPRAKTKPAPEPEAYYSDDDFAYRDEDPNAKNPLAVKRRKKEIPIVDYSKIEFEPVRKNFWTEPAELSALTEAETNDLRLELDGIKVSGNDVPKPVQKWAQCGLTRQTLDILADLGYERPTSIQMQALPCLMSGRDVIGVAKTGSGKTMAFLLPMFRHIKDQKPIRGDDGPIGLIMTPTRELAVQIHRDCKPFLKPMGMRAVCAYGGAPIKDQIADLKRGAEIVVCTPGRMIDLLGANQGRVTNLRRVSYVVLDEADRMFDMGFEPQVMKIFANMRPDRQTILFSATMPRIIDSLTKKVLKSPVEVTVGGRSVVAPEITQKVEVLDEGDKFFHLLGLLGELYEEDEDARSLIFVERQEKADDLLKELMTKGYPCMSIHGGKDQVDRDSTISDFKKGIVPILIATSVAARGLDVKQLKLVVNYDAPNHLEDYVHRAGRTGRAGNKGTAVTYITSEQENCAPGIAKALEQSGQPVPERLNEMRKAHRDKVKAGKAKDTSGFGGKGLDRLDAEREAARLRERKTHKAEGDDDDEKEEKPAVKEKEEEKPAVSMIQAATSAIMARSTAKPDGDAKDKESAQATGPGGKPLDKVSAAISAINQRLGKAGQLRSGQPIDNKGPDAGAYHATLEINDFPQKARWAVTNRTNVAKILEATGVSITTKGTFYPAGKEVPAGADPKLYILVEGDTEVVVGAAMTELTRLLSEGAVAADTADRRAPASGRYNVV